MARAGLRGCYMFNCGGSWPTRDVTFPPADWLGMFDHTLRETERLGLTCGVHNCDGFSEAGGSWITPKTSMTILVWTSADVGGPSPAVLMLPQPESREGFQQNIAIAAFPLPFVASLWPRKVSSSLCSARDPFRRGSRESTDVRALGRCPFAVHAFRIRGPVCRAILRPYRDQVHFLECWPRKSRHGMCGYSPTSRWSIIVTCPVEIPG